MPHSVSSSARAEILSANRANAYLTLLEIAHEDITTIRLVGNTIDVVSNGNTYTAIRLGIAMPKEADDELPTQTLSISNVDTSVLEALRTMGHQTTDRATVIGSVVRHTEPDTIERGPFEFELLSMSAGKGSIKLELGYQNILADNASSYYISPLRWPAVFVALFSIAPMLIEALRGVSAL